jgi:hypothetical protein
VDVSVFQVSTEEIPIYQVLTRTKTTLSGTVARSPQCLAEGDGDNQPHCQQDFARGKIHAKDIRFKHYQ